MEKAKVSAIGSLFSHGPTNNYPFQMTRLHPHHQRPGCPSLMERASIHVGCIPGARAAVAAIQREHHPAPFTYQSSKMTTNVRTQKEENQASERECVTLWLVGIARVTDGGTDAPIYVTFDVSKFNAGRVGGWGGSYIYSS